jgi:hypothetical protein
MKNLAGQTVAFSVELMAPCGMNCALCSAYQAYTHRLKPGQIKMTQCTGCRPRGKQCAYIKKSCGRLDKGKLDFCYGCEDFPCAHLARLDERYRRDYSYSMIATLRDIQARGVKEVLQAQRETHKCPRCGGVICIHNGKCYHCDEIKSWRG